MADRKSISSELIIEKESYTRSIAALLFGQEDDTWKALKADSEGYLYNKNMVKDPVTLDWVPAQKNEFNVEGDLIVSTTLPEGAAKDGTDIDAPTEMPTGGVGIRGWLSAIWTKLNGTIGVSGTFWQTTQPVSIVSLPLPSGAATEAKQTILESLIETLQELVMRLSLLAGMANAGAVALRVIPIASVSTAVTGTLTTVTTLTGITNIGAVPAYTISVAQQNLTAILANIQNVIPA